MDIVVGKVVSMLIFLLSALIATITPVLLAHRVASSKNKSRRGQVITASCNSLAGGVLLATCFVALIPFVEKSYSNAFLSQSPEQNISELFPYAEVTVLAGFFLVVFIEQIVACRHESKNSGSAAPSNNPVSAEEESLFSDEDDYNSCSNNNPGHSHSSDHSHHHLDLGSTKSLLHSVILVTTLGIHTLFEGMSIGLVTQINLLITLVIAVLLHSVCCSVALGVNISQQNIRRKSALLVCGVYSLMMPVGIAMGLALGEIKGFSGLLLTAVLQGIATGTFIYVLFIEIIPSTLTASSGGAKYAIVQMIFMLVGCIAMTTVIYFTHNHPSSPMSMVTVMPSPNATDNVP